MSHLVSAVADVFHFSPKAAPQWHANEKKDGHGSSLHIPDELMKWELHTDINEKQHVQHQMEKLCVKKSELSFARLCFLGLLSGAWMVLSACCAMTLASGFSEEGIRDIVSEFPILPKFILSLFAPVAMHFIVVFGGEFYSGLLKRRVTLQQAVRNWFWVFIWNALGCVFCCYIFGYLTQIFAEPRHRNFIIAAAEAKARISWKNSFLRAIPANILICTAIQMGISARDMVGKIMVLHFPLTLYTVASFEHSITNLVIVPMGIMYGADVSVGAWMWTNLIPSALGNMIGGGIIVGGFVTLLYSWDDDGHGGNLNVPAPLRRRGSLLNLGGIGLAESKSGIYGGLAALKGGLVRKLASPEAREQLDEGLRQLKEAQDALAAAQARLQETHTTQNEVIAAIKNSHRSFGSITEHEAEDSTHNSGKAHDILLEFPPQHGAGVTGYETHTSSQIVRKETGDLLDLSDFKL